MVDIHVLCDVVIVMVIKHQCVILSLLIGMKWIELNLICREGELRLCKKVGNEKEEVILDTRKDLKSDSTAEEIKEEVKENVNTNELPEVKLSEEDKRKSIKFSDNIEFK